MALAAGGSVADAFKAMAFTVASAGIWKGVGDVLDAALKGVEAAGQFVVRSITHNVVGGALSLAQGGSFLSGFASAGIGEAATLATGPGTELGNIKGGEGFALRLAVVSAAGGVASELTGGKFGNGAITAAFGFLYNACQHDKGCWTTAEEKGYLEKGDYLGYYSKACSGGDTYACSAYHIAANDNLAGHMATTLLVQGLEGQGIIDKLAVTLDEIRIKLANAYANYLPQSEKDARWPVALDIAEFHWSVFGKYGLPPRTFGGTPFGKDFALKYGVTGASKDMWPHWCPDCK